MTENHSKPLLDVKDLRVGFRQGREWPDAIHGVSFQVFPRETLCIVGESGSGKSVSSLAVMGLLPAGIARINGGSIHFDGKRIDTLSEQELNRIRGRDIGMIFQEPMTSLNPVHRIGKQISETLRLHEGLTGMAARARTLELLDMVQIPDKARRIDFYPHELSGGQRQRVMIAMALACRPRLLIADEPTTALDVSVQAQILSLIDELKRETGTGVIFITHDMGVVAEMADRVAVFRQGSKVEEGDVVSVLTAPQHEYTQMLLAATPKLGSGSWREGRVLNAVGEGGAAVPATPAAKPVAQDQRNIVLSAEGLVKVYGAGEGLFGRRAAGFRAVDGVSFELARGETLSIVGESGSGKSTVARMLMRVIKPTAGKIMLDGQPLHELQGEELRHARSRIQMVFQDPYASLHPQMTARQIVAEPMINLAPELDADAREQRIAEIFERCGLTRAMMDRYTFEFSGGQRQRLAIARAIVLRPDVVVADEAVSALDVSVQAQVLNLFAELQADLGLSYVFISHDLSVVEYISDHVAVMKMGEIVEMSPRADLYANPQHDYTRMLFETIPSLDPRERRLGHRLAGQAA